MRQKPKANPFHSFALKLNELKVNPKQNSDPEKLLKNNIDKHITLIDSLIETSPLQSFKSKPLITYEIKYICPGKTREGKPEEVEVLFICHIKNLTKDESSSIFNSITNTIQSIFDEYSFETIDGKSIPSYLSNPFNPTHTYLINRRVIIDRLDTLKTGYTIKKENFFKFTSNFSKTNVSTEEGTFPPEGMIFYIFPFVQSQLNTEQFFNFLALQDDPFTLSIKMQPTELTEEEEEFLEEQIERCEKFAQISIYSTSDDTSKISPTLQKLARDYQDNLIKFLLGLKHNCALLTIEVTSPKELSPVTLNSIAQYISSPPGREENTKGENYLCGGYEIIYVKDGNKSPYELKLYPHPLVPEKYTRLLYIFDSSNASCAFRFPPTPLDVLTNFKTKLHEERPAPQELSKEGCLIGVNIYKNFENEVRINYEDRKRHVYIIGQTGTGKTTLLKTMILDDIKAGNGICVIDPHGDLFKDILGKIPKNRLNDVVILDPRDIESPVGFNPLEYKDPEHRYFIVQEFIGILRRLLESEYGRTTSEIAGPIFYQHVRMNLLLVMSDPDNPGTLLEFYLIFQNNYYWRRFKPKIKDPLLENWINNVLPEVDYTGYSSDKISLGDYIASKFQNFIFDPYLRDIFAQRRSTINFTEIMNSGKILLINLAKGELTEENSRFLGMLIMTKILTSALERIKIPPEKRKDFFVYVDEFQSIATNSFTTLLSEARKFGIYLVLANQFIKQIQDEKITLSIFGNVGTIICFRLGQEDASMIEQRFSPYINKFHLTNLPNWNAYVITLINGQTTAPFNIRTKLDTTPYSEKVAQTVRELSRQKYSRKREEVEEEIKNMLPFPTIITELE
jgi:DNA helicase HerA-like ATPase